MQLISDATKITILQPYIGVGQGLIPSSEVHPLSKIIGDIDERTTQSRSMNSSHFAHASFVATFGPKDIGHALSDAN
jgi:hypothetical protein